MQSSWFRSSPSFIIGSILVLIVGGFYLWRWNRPNARARSDIIVRDFVATAQREVRNGRREMDRAADRVRSGAEAPEVMKSIDEAAETARVKVEDHAKTALEALEQIDTIPLRTEQNRRKRIRSRLREMTDAISEARTNATESVQEYIEERAAR